ncbi:MAG: tyrosine-type recombinase/integrase [Clostridiales bacterium]|nr:tyrosine-type recombinase/integrase [Clostridiales bacterium]
MSDYINERDARYQKKLQAIIKESLPDFCKEFFNGIAMNTTVLTRYNYAIDLKLFFEFTVLWGSVFEGKSVKDIMISDLELIESTDIEEFLVYIDNYYNANLNTRVRNKNSAKARKFCSVRALFRYLFKKDKISRNITLKVSMPKLREKEIVRLSDNEVSNIFDSLKDIDVFESEKMNAYNNNNIKVRDNAIFTLMLGTGIRISECVGLNVDDINFADNSFTVTRKGEKRSILYFNDDIASNLKAYLEFREKMVAKRKIEPKDQKALFLSLQGKRISVRAVELMVKKYAKIAAPLKNITPHKLRSTYGTALYRATQDIYVVAEVLGHKDINTTKKHYAAISEDIKKSAANKVKFNKE